MHRKQWIFDMDGTLTDSMTVVWQGAPLELLRRYGREARPGIHDVLLSMGMVEGAEYLIHTYDLPLTLRDYEPAMRQVIRDLYQKVELKPGVREMLARLKAEGARMCICSNTWADQCEEVLTRLGVADYFEFFCTAQGAKSKAVWAAAAPPTPSSVKTPSTPPVPQSSAASTSSTSRMRAAPPTSRNCSGLQTSTYTTGHSWTGRSFKKRFYRKAKITAT